MARNDWGFVFAATGPVYTRLARRAARNLLGAMPEAQVDLFTDQPVTDDAFARIHPLPDSFFRPKMWALRESRFERTVYLDADAVVVAPVGDVFEVLSRFDLAASHGVYSNSGLARRLHDGPLPAAFPQINSGVLAVRRTKATSALLREWEEQVRARDATRDQPALRELLWRSELRVHVLPRQYNLNGIEELRGWTTLHAAPRILHAPSLHRNPREADPTTPIALREILTPRQEAKLRELAEADHGLSGLSAPRLAGSRPLRAVQILLSRLA